MTTITLPPLPPTDKILKIGNDIDGNIEYVYYWNSDTLRARDLEVARAVLEGAAQAARSIGNHYWPITCADAINALEVKHHE
jgi:hypothetical protein